MRADLAWEDVVDRCRSCSKRLQVDLGQDVFGNATGAMFCLSCGVIPQTSPWDSANIRAAVAQVVTNSQRGTAA